jgi:hypothetical protein
VRRAMTAAISSWSAWEALSWNSARSSETVWSSEAVSTSE